MVTAAAASCGEKMLRAATATATASAAAAARTLSNMGRYGILSQI